MKEYKVVEVRRPKAEDIMNDMAKQGWEVVSTVCWGIYLVITFSKEV